jgi:hypothetical protein
MKRIAAALLALAALAQPAAAEPIRLDQLQTMFANMRAKTSWNIDGPLLWGYFFFDADAAKLRKAAAELQAQGYRLVALEAVEGKLQFRLQVEKAEVHTPESLHKRNGEFYALAEKYGIAAYDGMDVGPVPEQLPPKP